MRPLLVALAVLASSSFAAADEPPAPAFAPEPAPTPAPPADGVDHRQSMWRFELGYRASLFADSGFDPFSKNDRLSQVSLVATRTLLTHGRFSFAPGLAFESGGSDSTARGDPTSLDVTRFAVPLDGRVHFGPWGYAFVRVAPGATLVGAEVKESSTTGPLQKRTLVFSTDLSAGYAWLAWPWNEPEKMRGRLWLQADAGYGFAVRDGLSLTPDAGSSGVTNNANVDLGSLVLRGPFARVAVALSF
jgi:hypothetical protein